MHFSEEQIIAQIQAHEQAHVDDNNQNDELPALRAQAQLFKIFGQNSRFNSQGFVSKAVIPDGKGGVTEISLGENFTRVFCASTSGRIHTGELMRSVKKSGTDLTKKALPALSEGAMPKVILANIGTVNYGIKTLAQCLQAKGIETETITIIDPGCVNQFTSAVNHQEFPL